DNGELIPFTLHPEGIGLPTYSYVEIRGGNAREKADIVLSVLEGKEGPYLDTVLLNAGLGLFEKGTAHTDQESAALASESITSGAAMDRLQQLVNYSKTIKREVI